MRIIAGKYRRRKIAANPGETTRPITDRMKETLFERLHDWFINKRVADVFSGTGTIGLEALSRGARSVVFMENDRQAYKLLQENIESIGIEEFCFSWRVNVLRSSFRPKGVDEFLPFDAIFFDPPYRMIKDITPGSEIYRCLERLCKAEVSSADAILILRTPRDEPFEMPDCWELERSMPLATSDIYLYHKRS